METKEVRAINYLTKKSARTILSNRSTMMLLIERLSYISQVGDEAQRRTAVEKFYETLSTEEKKVFNTVLNASVMLKSMCDEYAK